LIEFLQGCAVDAQGKSQSVPTESCLHEISDLLLSNVGTSLNTHQVTSAVHSLSILRYVDATLLDAITKAVDSDGDNWYVKHAAISDLATLLYSLAMLEYVPHFSFTNALTKKREALLINNDPTAIAYASFSLAFLVRHAAGAEGKGYDALPYEDVVRPWFDHIDERAECLVGDFATRADEEYNTRNAGLLALAFADLKMGAEEGGFGLLSALDDRVESIADMTSAEDLANFLTYFAVVDESEKAKRLLRVFCLKRLFVLSEEEGVEDEWVVNVNAVDSFFGEAIRGPAAVFDDLDDLKEEEEEEEKGWADDGYDDGILDDLDDVDDDDYDDLDDDDLDDDDFDDDDLDDVDHENDEDYSSTSANQALPELKVDAITNLLKAMEDLNITELPQFNQLLRSKLSEADLNRLDERQRENVEYLLNK